MRVLVPFDERRPKTRLSDSLDAEERRAFARAMLGDVVAAVGAAARSDDSPTVDSIDVLSTAPLPPPATLVDDGEGRSRDWSDDASDGPSPERSVVVDERDLTTAVNDVLASAGEPVAVVMADLALATPSTLARLFSAGGGEGRNTVTLVPGRGGGTNALVARHPEFRVDYHGLSFRDHRHRAGEVGAALHRVDSYRLSTDVDERADLPEVLLHGGPRSRAWLRRAGFEVAITDGRVGVGRE